MLKEKIIIGRIEKIDIPDYSIFNISAKIDTGAYTSAIYASPPKVQGGKISFYILNSNGTKASVKKFTTKKFKEKKIKNSFGDSEKRFIVKIKILVFGKEIETDFSLSDRSKMKNPVLLGRKFLGGKFIVDISKFNLSYKAKRKKKKND